MRAVVVLVLALPACGDIGAGPRPDAEVDAPPPPIDAPFYPRLCDSPAGTAAISAEHQDLEPQYARMFAGGEILDDLFLYAFFTNDALTAAADVANCAHGAACASGGFVVEATIARGDELGAHTALIRNGTSTWQATGTLTLTDFVWPAPEPGRLAGSIVVDSTAPLVTIDGSFDHTFCLDLVGVLLP